MVAENHVRLLTTKWQIPNQPEGASSAERELASLVQVHDSELLIPTMTRALAAEITDGSGRSKRKKIL